MSTLNLNLDVHLLKHAPFPYAPRTFLERFVARFDYAYSGLAVLATETSTDVWTITTHPGISTMPTDDLNASDYQFFGGQTYEVTGTLATALTNAGYTVS